MDDGNDHSGFASFKKPTPAACGEHPVLPEILDEVIPSVTRERIFNRRDDLVDGSNVSDSDILNTVNWDGYEQREKKWLYMLAEFVVRSTPQVVDRFNESADAVAIYLDDCNCASGVTAGLRRETFDSDTPIDVPRTVLYRAEKRVKQMDDIDVEAVLDAHREAVGNDEIPVQ